MTSPSHTSSQPPSAPAAATPNFGAIHRVVDAYLAAGGPRRIHFWDMDHSSPAPRQVYSDPALLATVRQHGPAAYIVENGSPQANKEYERYRFGNDTQRARIARDEAGIAAFYQPLDETARARFLAARMRVLDASRSTPAVPVYSPDTRGDLQLGLNGRERTLLVHHLQGGFVAKGECLAGYEETYARYMHGREQGMLQRATSAFTRLASPAGSLESGALDANIADNIRAHAARAGAPAGEVQLIIYGGAHYLKANDLNEQLPGLSIAVVDEKRPQHLMPLSQVHSLPDFAWYHRANGGEGRLVALNTDAARAAFLGMSEQQYAAFALSRTLPPAHVLSPEAQKACDDALHQWMQNLPRPIPATPEPPRGFNR